MVHWMASGVCSGQGRTIPSLGAIKPIGPIISIDQAVIEAKPAGVFHIASCSLHQGLKDSSLNPFEKPTLNGTLWSKTRGRSFQFAPLSSTSYRQAVLPRQCAKTYRDDRSPRARLSGLAHCKFIRYERPGFRLIQNFPLLGGLQNESS
jgi:hypothetical protein